MSLEIVLQKEVSEGNYTFLLNKQVIRSNIIFLNLTNRQTTQQIETVHTRKL